MCMWCVVVALSFGCAEIDAGKVVVKLLLSSYVVVALVGMYQSLKRGCVCSILVCKEMIIDANHCVWYQPVGTIL